MFRRRLVDAGARCGDPVATLLLSVLVLYWVVFVILLLSCRVCGYGG
jgi:hypothetical protein